MLKEIISIDIRLISSFYHTSHLYNQFYETFINDNNDHLITLEANKYLPLDQSKNELIKEISYSTEDFLLLLSIVDFWGFDELPLLVLECYQNLSNKDKEYLFSIIELDQIKIPMGKEFLVEVANKLKSLKSCLQAVQYGYLECLRFAKEMGWDWDIRVSYRAASLDHLHCLQYIHNEKGPWDGMTCAQAARTGNIRCLQFLHEHGCPWDWRTCSYAALNGHLNCLIYAHEHGCDWDPDTCAKASFNGHLHCLQYAHENGCPWNEYTCSNASGRNQLRCLQYAHENGCNWNAETYQSAMKKGYVSCWNYALVHGCPQL